MSATKLESGHACRVCGTWVPVHASHVCPDGAAPGEDVVTAACGRALAANGAPDPLPRRDPIGWAACSGLPARSRIPSFSSVAQGPAADRGAA